MLNFDAEVGECVRALLIYGAIKGIRTYRNIIHFTYVVHLIQFLRVFCSR